IVLCGAFYLLVSFESDVQMKLVARQRGQRVIQYIDQRIRNAGLGFGKLEKASEVQNALSPFTKSSDRPLYNSRKDSGSNVAGLRLPVALTYSYRDPCAKNENPNPYKYYENKEKHVIQWGNILTLLYPKRDTDKNFVIVPISEDISNDIITVQSVDIVQNGTQDFIYVNRTTSEQISGSNFEVSSSGSAEGKYIENWTVLTAAGIPLIITAEKAVSLKNSSTDVYAVSLKNISETEVRVNAGDEMLYLKGERMFAKYINDQTWVRDFVFQEIADNSEEWGAQRPYQDGILAMYFEIDTDTNTLDFWVLTTGGQDGKIHDVPASWPEKGKEIQFGSGGKKWNNVLTDYFKYHVMYVSHASWKLENIPEGFNWNS
ncbi:MAG: hypothetical protein IJQ47_06325, partial [Synergistaceae bacterium]|nr:hypothetical protein [Synergistaceae bacterium]